jgi:hypothetical protein
VVVVVGFPVAALVLLVAVAERALVPAEVEVSLLLEVCLDMPVSVGGAACSRSHCLRLAMSVGSSALAEGEEAESEAFLAKLAATSTSAAAAAFSFITTSASGC